MPTKANLEILFSRHGAAWHVRVHGWPSPFVRRKLGDYEALPVREPDLKDLEAFMRERLAPYAQATTTFGDVAIEGRGRSAVALWEWLDRYLIAA